MTQAVDLNLRLMKWRLWPQLDTSLLANTTCLLLGAGTLGSWQKVTIIVMMMMKNMVIMMMVVVVVSE
jgi:hypothetical protein